MRNLIQFSAVAASLATAFACSAPITSKSADLGVFEVDGPVVIDLSVTAVPYGKSDCSDLSPNVFMYWHGDEAPVELGATVGKESYDEDTIAADGELLTTVSGRWTKTTDARCEFNAIVTMVSEEALSGTLTLSAQVDYGERSSAESVSGHASVESIEGV